MKKPYLSLFHLAFSLQGLTAQYSCSFLSMLSNKHLFSTDIPIFSIGAVERVKKIRDYAFVHFNKREDAVHAMKALNGKVKLL